MVSYITGYNVSIEGYLKQLPGLDSRAVGDCQVTSEGGRFAKCIALRDVELNG
jgi:hypothetical protein